LKDKDKKRKKSRADKRKGVDKKSQRETHWRIRRTEKKKQEREVADGILKSKKTQDLKAINKRIFGSSVVSNNDMAESEGLLIAINNKAPKLVYDRYFSALRFLFNVRPWINNPNTWEPKGKGKDTVFRSLVEHLLVKYPMPKFFYRAFLNDGHTSLQLVRLFKYLAQGGSFKKAIGTKLMTVPFTKKMCHSFLNTSANVDVLDAIRATQVKAFGGDQRLLIAILRTPLGETLDLAVHGAEPFWHTVIQWLCSNPMLDPTQVGPLYDYIVHCRRQDRTFKITGRSVMAMLRGMEEWHRELCHQKKLKGDGIFPTSSFPNKKWVVEKKINGKKVKQYWEVIEILNMKELFSEGRALRHCVGSYSYRVENGYNSIWSLRCDGERRVTIEVANKTAMIGQIRGYCNRLPAEEEKNRIRYWAREDGLKIKSFPF